jgi:hypothetical protein
MRRLEAKGGESKGGESNITRSVANRRWNAQHWYMSLCQSAIIKPIRSSLLRFTSLYRMYQAKYCAELWAKLFRDRSIGKAIFSGEGYHKVWMSCSKWSDLKGP